jgi:Ca2+-binding RTX toxin-like protein
VSTAQLIIYGSSNTRDDLYVFTNEYSNYAGTFGHSTVVTDSDDGIDTINAAAVTLASVIDLNAGATSVIDGAPLTIAAGPIIENAFGGDGDDTLIGNSSENTLVGNRGNDAVEGGYGSDQIFGGAGDDALTGGAGGDALNGGAGVDAASYATSPAGVTVDLLTGQTSGGDAAGDALAGVEDLIGSVHADALTGDDGNNLLKGGGGGDALDGGAGDDTIAGDGGNDSLTGGVGGDVLDGGAGSDAASYAASIAAVTVDLSTGASSGGDAAGDTFSGIENLIGSAHADTLAGSARTNALIGGAGNDTLVGGGGNDTLTGGAGEDVLDGGAGIDAASYADSSSRVNIHLVTGAVWGGHATGDSLIGIENLIGSAFDDTLIGSSESNALNGGLGSDRLAGGDGNDTLTGGASADTLNGGAGDDTSSYRGSTSGVMVNLATSAASGGHADGDTVTGIENLTGSAHADSLTGDAGNNVLNGGLGSDILTGETGADAFVFNGVLGEGNVDQITDFSAFDDTIRLENAVFHALTSSGALSAAAFSAGLAAGDADDRIIYDSGSGALYYDVDGAGELGPVQFATLSSLPGGVTHADFLVV